MEPGKDYFRRDGFTVAFDLAIAEAIRHDEKELLYIPGKGHIKEVCATLNQAHKLQIGTQLLEANNGYCTISDGAESLKTKYLAQQLSRRDADGNLKARALDLTMLQSKTSEAQAE
eukprot:5774384-Pleurochrysis_carterae.AAC.1